MCRTGRSLAGCVEAKLLQSRVVTEQHAVFSVWPGVDALRPPQKTSIPNLFLAGDWTATGWPATMEGAVRSGYLAAEGVLASLERREKLLAPDLPRPWLVRLLIGKSFDLSGTEEALSSCSITPSKNFASRCDATIAVSRKRHKSLTVEGRRKIVPAAAPIRRTKFFS